MSFSQSLNCKDINSEINEIEFLVNKIKLLQRKNEDLQRENQKIKNNYETLRSQTEVATRFDNTSGCNLLSQSFPSGNFSSKFRISTAEKQPEVDLDALTSENHLLKQRLNDTLLQLQSINENNQNFDNKQNLPQQNQEDVIHPVSQSPVAVSALAEMLNTTDPQHITTNDLFTSKEKKCLNDYSFLSCTNNSSAATMMSVSSADLVQNFSSLSLPSRRRMVTLPRIAQQQMSRIQHDAIAVDLPLTSCSYSADLSNLKKNEKMREFEQKAMTQTSFEDLSTNNCAKISLDSDRLHFFKSQFSPSCLKTLPSLQKDSEVLNVSVFEKSPKRDKSMDKNMNDCTNSVKFQHICIEDSTINHDFANDEIIKKCEKLRSNLLEKFELIMNERGVGSFGPLLSESESSTIRRSLNGVALHYKLMLIRKNQEKSKNHGYSFSGSSCSSLFDEIMKFPCTDVSMLWIDLRYCIIGKQNKKTKSIAFCAIMDLLYYLFDLYPDYAAIFIFANIEDLISLSTKNSSVLDSSNICENRDLSSSRSTHDGLASFTSKYSSVNPIIANVVKTISAEPSLLRLNRINPLEDLLEIFHLLMKDFDCLLPDDFYAVYKTCVCSTSFVESDSTRKTKNDKANEYHILKACDNNKNKIESAPKYIVERSENKDVSFFKKHVDSGISSSFIPDSMCEQLPRFPLPFFLRMHDNTCKEIARQKLLQHKKDQNRAESDEQNHDLPESCEPLFFGIYEDLPSMFSQYYSKENNNYNLNVNKNTIKNDAALEEETVHSIPAIFYCIHSLHRILRLLNKLTSALTAVQCEKRRIAEMNRNDFNASIYHNNFKENNFCSFTNWDDSENIALKIIKRLIHPILTVPIIHELCLLCASTNPPFRCLHADRPKSSHFSIGGHTNDIKGQNYVFEVPNNSGFDNSCYASNMYSKKPSQCYKFVHNLLDTFCFPPPPLFVLRLQLMCLLRRFIICTNCNMHEYRYLIESKKEQNRIPLLMLLSSFGDYLYPEFCTWTTNRLDWLYGRYFLQLPTRDYLHHNNQPNSARNKAFDDNFCGNFYVEQLVEDIALDEIITRLQCEVLDIYMTLLQPSGEKSAEWKNDEILVYDGSEWGLPVAWAPTPIIQRIIFLCWKKLLVLSELNVWDMPHSLNTPTCCIPQHSTFKSRKCFYCPYSCQKILHSATASKLENRNFMVNMHGAQQFFYYNKATNIYDGLSFPINLQSRQINSGTAESPYLMIYMQHIYLHITSTISNHLKQQTINLQCVIKKCIQLLASQTCMLNMFKAREGEDKSLRQGLEKNVSIENASLISRKHLGKAAPLLNAIIGFIERNGRDCHMSEFLRNHWMEACMLRYRLCENYSMENRNNL